VPHVNPIGQGSFIGVNPNFSGLVFGHAFESGINIGPITVDLPGGGQPCPPGTIELFGACVGLGGNGGAGPPPGGTGGCPPGFHRGPVTGECILTGFQGPGPQDPTPQGDTPAERLNGATPGPVLPSRVARNVHVCPDFQDGSMGILYFNPTTNGIVCLPRSFSTRDAAAFGLIRKNKPRAKAAVTAADMKLLNKISSIQGKIGRAADRAGALSCPPKKKVGSKPTAKGLSLKQRKAGFGGKAAQRRAGG